MQIEIREYISQKPNGDRDTRRHDCSLFKVVGINGFGKEFVFAEYDCYDAFHSHINKRGTEYDAACDYARRLCIFLDYGSGFTHKKFREKQVTKTEWVSCE